MTGANNPNSIQPERNGHNGHNGAAPDNTPPETSSDGGKKKAWTFTKLPNSLIRDPRLSPTAKFVYALLLSYWSTKSPTPWPKLTTLTYYANIQEDTLRECMNELCHFGYLRIEQRRATGQKFASNYYTLLNGNPAMTEPYKRRGRGQKASIGGVFNEKPSDEKPGTVLPGAVEPGTEKPRAVNDRTKESKCEGEPVLKGEPFLLSSGPKAPRPKDKDNNNSDREAVARNGNAAAAPSAVAVPDSASQFMGGYAPQTPEGKGERKLVYQRPGESGSAATAKAARNGKRHDSPALATEAMDDTDQDGAEGDHVLPGVKRAATSPAAGTPVVSANKATSSPDKTRAGGAAEQQAGAQQAQQTRGGTVVDKRQKKLDAATAKAQEKADKAVRYLLKAQKNLVDRGIKGFRPLRDSQVAQFTGQLRDYFVDNPTYITSRVIATIIACWITERSDAQWHAKKICESVLVATMEFKGKPYPNLDGAIIQLGIGDLDQGNLTTDEFFKSAGILDDWKTEHRKRPTKTDAPAPTGHSAPSPVPDDEARKLEILLDVLGPGPVVETNWESMVNERFPGLFQFHADFHAMVEILNIEGEIEKTIRGWVRL